MVVRKALDTKTFGLDQSSLIFSNSIDGWSDYEHLELSFNIRGTRTNSSTYTEIRFNGDTGSNYSTRRIHASGSNLYGQSAASEAYMFLNKNQTVAGDTADSSVYSYGRLTIYDYLHANKNTTISEDWSTLLGDLSYGHCDRVTGVWDNTAALTTIVIEETQGSYNVKRESTVTLYGIKSS
tara:strand:- start:527 stop:1069 length:543 start_codon:yes stop_codon:yes gene_type:complete